MGAGGQKTTNDEYEAQQLKGSILRRVPGEKPPFSVGQLKQAIPPHCFQRSVLRSFSYLTYDLIIISALLYLAQYQIPKLPSPCHYIAWPLYWIFQGCFATGVWVIGHECGHHAFSDYQLLDDIVGLILHSSMLVPYFSFKHSHRRHHANTGSMDTDEVYIPRTKHTLPWFDRYFKNPLSRSIVFIVILVVGWPLYIAFNVSGRRYPRFACHFDPYSPIYSEQERAQVIISDATILAVSYMLYRRAVASSFGWVFAVYGVPVLILNGWVVLITYLQHTHIALPHFDSSEWTWLRGALATMDRDFGAILNKVFHNVTDTHILHHLFSMIPHYHAMEATEAIKPILGEYYRIDRTPLFKAMWRDNAQCVYVEPEAGKSKGVYWYDNKF